MYKNNQTKSSRPIVAQPATATPEVCQALEAKLVAHYTPILTPALMIAHRNGCYATVINSTISGIDLTNTVGTAYAKEMTEAVLKAITANISAVS